MKGNSAFEKKTHLQDTLPGGLGIRFFSRSHWKKPACFSRLHQRRNIFLWLRLVTSVSQVNKFDTQVVSYQVINSPLTKQEGKQKYTNFGSLPPNPATMATKRFRLGFSSLKRQCHPGRNKPGRSKAYRDHLTEEIRIQSTTGVTSFDEREARRLYFKSRFT